METLLALPEVSRRSPGGLPEVSRRSPARTICVSPKKLNRFAPNRVTLLVMPMSKKELDAFRQAITRGPDRSPLFWWLVEQHDELTADGAAGRQDWKRHCATMARDGVVDAKGKPPNIEAARKAWQIVRKEVATGRAKRPATSESPPTARSRQQGNCSPPITAARASAQLQPPVPTIRGYDLDEELPPRRPMAEPGAGSDGTPEKKMTIADLSPEGRAKIERLRQQFAETDRKRFGSF